MASLLLPKRYPDHLATNPREPFLQRMKLIKTEVIPQVHREIDEANRQVKDFQQLPDDILRYRPQPDQWSVLDCLEHMNLFYADYFSRMEPAIRQAIPSDRMTYTPGFFGQKMVNSLRPHQGKRKMKTKTFKKMIPATDEKASETIFKVFFQYHARLKQLLDRSKALDWNKVKVASAIGPILRFKVGDCFRLLMAHTERHLVQSQKVLSKRTP